MITYQLFIERLQRMAVASLFIVAPIWTLAAMAHAQDLPKEGTYSTTWSFSGPYKVLSLGEDKYSWMSNFTLVVWNNAGEGVFHDMSGDCVGLGVGDKGNGYCALVDGDGDKVFWAFTDLGDGKGKAVFEGGTGKYQGLEGGEDYEFVYTPDAPEGTFHGHGGSNGSYKLP
jgi:hypothetical protein